MLKQHRLCVLKKMCKKKKQHRLCREEETQFLLMNIQHLNFVNKRNELRIKLNNILMILFYC